MWLFSGKVGCGYSRLRGDVGNHRLVGMWVFSVKVGCGFSPVRWDVGILL